MTYATTGQVLNNETKLGLHNPPEDMNAPHSTLEKFRAVLC